MAAETVPSTGWLAWQKLLSEEGQARLGLAATRSGPDRRSGTRAWGSRCCPNGHRVQGSVAPGPTIRRAPLRMPTGGRGDEGSRAWPAPSRTMRRERERDRPWWRRDKNGVRGPRSKPSWISPCLVGITLAYLVGLQGPLLLRFGSHSVPSTYDVPRILSERASKEQQAEASSEASLPTSPVSVPPPLNPVVATQAAAHCG